jgi:hypothetical protein
MRFEGVPPEPVRRVTFELRRTPGEDQAVPCLRADRELGQQTRLADAGLSDHLHECRLAAGKTFQFSFESGELVLASGQLRRRH